MLELKKKMNRNLFIKITEQEIPDYMDIKQARCNINKNSSK